MTVAELIQELYEMPQDAQVYCPDCNGSFAEDDIVVEVVETTGNVLVYTQ